MKNLYLILKKDSNKTTFSLLKKSAKKRGISIKTVYVENFDFSKERKLTKEDGLFRLSTTAEASLIEEFLINKDVNTFFTNYLFCIGKVDNVVEGSLIQQKNNLPIIKTIFSITNDRKILKKYVAYLGGFPIIIKSRGGMHGVGVMKIDSQESLNSIVDYLVTQKDIFVMRSYVPHKRQARLIVLGDKVITSHENLASIDFRSNVGDNKIRQRQVVKYDKNIQELAVKAVNVLGYEFGGVDILFDENTNKPYIAEVNFPCFFPTTQNLTKVDIAGRMIDFLIKKSKSKK